MNSALYKQADSRWGYKPYPTRDCTMSGAGCGCVACTHIVIEQEKYKNYTPENLRPWMVNQGFAIRNQGTTWSGITKTLQHYGYSVTHIGIGDPMSKAWAELNKGNRIGIILFKGGSGPNGTVWTAGGHYVAFTDYKVVDGKHYFYTKDSGGRNHDSAKYGYYSYENSMKGVVYQMWIVPRIGKTVTTTTKTTTTTVKAPTSLTVDGSFGKQSVLFAQKVFGTTQDGIISGQNKNNQKYYKGIDSSCIQFGSGGSGLIRAIQKKVGTTQDGVIGPATVKGIQKLVGVTQDGYWGSGTSKAFQTWLNKQAGVKGTTTSNKTTTTKTTTTPKVEEVVDVSYVQSKTIDWAKVKAAGISGAIVRCGYRGYGSSAALKEDSMFLNHIKGAYKAGLKVGIYFFTEAVNEAEGRAEARFALAQLKKSGVKITYPIAVDTENISASNPTPRANSNKLSVANRTAAIKGFCEEIKKNGYEPMIYASTSWLNNQLNMSKLPYKVWVAQYNSSVTYKGSYIMWQYTSTGKVNGISGVVDKSHSYYALGNTKSTTSTTTKSTTTKTTTKPVLKSIDVVAKEVIDGKWGSGEERKKKLTAAGYNYNAVQKKVNELLQNISTRFDKANAWAIKMANDPYYGYRQFTDRIRTHICAICNKFARTDEDYGTNCINWVFQIWRHGAGIPCNCSPEVINNQQANKIIRMKAADALAYVRERVGNNDIAVYRTADYFPIKNLKKGDIVVLFKGLEYYHMEYYMGDGKFSDARSNRGVVANVALESDMIKDIKMVIRYTGK